MSNKIEPPSSGETFLDAKLAGGKILRLTLHEAISQVLQGNRTIQVAAFDPKIAQKELKAAKTVYDPVFFMGGNSSRTDRPTQNILDVGNPFENALLEDRWRASTGIKTLLPTGGNFSLSQEVDYLDSNSEYTTPNPQNTSRLQLQIEQPLLQGLLDSKNQTVIKISNLNIAVANEEFRRQVAETLAEVATSYWELSLNREGVRISQQVLEMAEEVDRQEKSRLARGISTPPDAARARATAERRRVDLLRDRNRVQTTEFRLLQLMNLQKILPDGAIEIFSVDPPLESAPVPDRNKALAKSLELRPELEKSKKAVEMEEIRMKLASHQRLPQLDAKFSYTSNSLAEKERRALAEVYDGDRESWLAGLEFEWPIGGRQTGAEFLRARLSHERSLTDMKRIREQIEQEVFQTVNDIELARAEVETTKSAFEAAEKILAAEKTRFELAQVTNQDLLQSQDLFSDSEKRYWQAVIGLNIALVKFELAQGNLLESMGVGIEAIGGASNPQSP